MKFIGNTLRKSVTITADTSKLVDNWRKTKAQEAMIEIGLLEDRAKGICGLVREMEGRVSMPSLFEIRRFNKKLGLLRVCLFNERVNREMNERR